jgi:SHS2 domain-containing protein
MGNMKENAVGFQEIEHTADWELEAWGPDLASMLEQAARGMAALAGARCEPAPRSNREIELDALDPESLVVSFLSEILYYWEEEGLGFDKFRLSLDGMHLNALLEGAPIRTIDKEIKAVTWHKLNVQFQEGQVKVRVVFDV